MLYKYSMALPQVNTVITQKNSANSFWHLNFLPKFWRKAAKCQSKLISFDKFWGIIDIAMRYAEDKEGSRTESVLCGYQHVCMDQTEIWCWDWGAQQTWQRPISTMAIVKVYTKLTDSWDENMVKAYLVNSSSLSNDSVFDTKAKANKRHVSKLEPCRCSLTNL